jgi:hypothetical protein
MLSFLSSFVLAVSSTFLYYLHHAAILLYTVFQRQIVCYILNFVSETQFM